METIDFLEVSQADLSSSLTFSFKKGNTPSEPSTNPSSSSSIHLVINVLDLTLIVSTKFLSSP